MSKPKQASTQVEPQVETFFKVKRKNGAFSIVEIQFDVANQKLISVSETEEDLLKIVLNQIEKRIRTDLEI